MTFELDRFAWSPGALEVSGRWVAESPRRFRHVRLVVLVDGRPRKLAPSRATPMRATPDGQPWAATFPWEGDHAPEQPVLEAGHDLLVELPAPHRIYVIAGSATGRHELPDPAAFARLEAEVAALNAELTAERDYTAAVKRLLATERKKLAEAKGRAHDEELAAQAEAREEAWRVAEQLAAERKALAAEREEIEALRKAVEAQSLPEPAAAAAETEPDGAVAERPRRELPSPNGTGPRHAAIQHALERPRQPDDHVRGGAAPLAVRIVAVALVAGLLVMLATILHAVV